MAQPARRPEVHEEPIDLDPRAIERAYRYHRAQRRAKVRRRRESREAHLRFYVAMLVLTAAAIALVLGTWHEIQKLFGL